jgi:anti-sigma regulatory factor (Ser/Thr protein kinase)
MSEERIEVRLPHDATAAEQARRLVGERLRAVLPWERLAEVVLITDELVTNAVRHAQPDVEGGVGLRLDRLRDRVRVVVTDGSPGFEWAGRASPELAGGFGLVLVDRIADRWGLSLDGRKAVWFEIDLPGASAADPRA